MRKSPVRSEAGRREVEQVESTSAAAGGRPSAASLPRPPSATRKKINEDTRARLGTTGILLFGVAMWQAGSVARWWSPAVIPAPEAVLRAASETIGTEVFLQALRVTLQEIALSFVGGTICGGILGVLFWKVPYLGRIAEPYLVSFYSVPFIVFYPIMVVLIGLNSWPIILLATLMGTIPMSLNTWIGLASVNPVYWKLAASLECNRVQTLFRIALPAAAPVIFGGVRLAAIYALIGSVSMEFLLAPNGLGFQIRYRYELFEQASMVFYVLVVFVIASILAFAVAAVEGRILGRRSNA